ncbi:hypothetical protein C8J56DRAFT_300599 [Mycena floridula]|nr:hypothetical protein C8J56DRAFT_300599 [Mycena floridula]
MSLSSLLLSGKKAKIDTELDALFSKPSSTKRKHEETRNVPVKRSKPVAEPAVVEVDKGKSKAVESDYDNDGSSSEELVHESLLKAGKKTRTPKAAFVPAEDNRDARTVFIGNLPVQVAQKKTHLKQLHRYILALVPTAKIESTRFRSVAFKAPVAKLPDDEKKEVKHDPRAASWKARQGGDDEGSKTDEKQYLNPQQKKKIAFINQEFHSSVDTLNAYIVFAHPVPAESRPANLPPLPQTLDPYEAARQTIAKCNGTMFMDRMMRVDLVEKKAGVSTPSGVEEDPKLSIFVGSLDFASKEEDLRVFFEGVMSAERGPPGEEEDEDEDVPRKAKTWVTRVRIIRDKDTQLGKGFAYVQFSDRQCVDEVLALEPAKLKFAKRKLRVQRCKTLPGVKASIESKANPAKSHSPSIPIPRGDPLLGEKLVHLSKDERKKVKSSDGDRVARRLHKKKSRMALDVAGVKDHGKDRDRVRKPTVNKGGKSTAPQKKRVRSDKSAAKRNHKK